MNTVYLDFAKYAKELGVTFPFEFDVLTDSLVGQLNGWTMYVNDPSSAFAGALIEEWIVGLYDSMDNYVSGGICPDLHTALLVAYTLAGVMENTDNETAEAQS